MNGSRTIRWMMVGLAVLVLAPAVLADPTQGEIKWSQPPVRLAVDPWYIYGWDEPSMWDDGWGPIVADDFLCTDPRPVVDLHWWGSYPGPGTAIPPVHPDGFLIRFWTDVPVGADPNPDIIWSHPGEPIHEIWCFDYNVSPDPVGQDIDVWVYDETTEIVVMDDCYQYNQDLRPEDYFWQEPDNIYWISIQALYEDMPEFPWGWKTRWPEWNDDAVIGIEDADGTIWWNPLFDGERSWDMSYELTVPEPATLALMAAGLVTALIRRRR